MKQNHGGGESREYINPAVFFRISGMADLEEPLLNDTYWFELYVDDKPKIVYFGNGVVYRIDHAK